MCMQENIDILRLACLIQDRDNQDFKRAILSVICELLYENSNINLDAGDLYKATITKCKEPIERDFFDSILSGSNAIVITVSETEPLVRLTDKKMNEVESNISEFAIDPSITTFLNARGYDEKYKESILDILYQSIYENIYAFNPDNTKTLVPKRVERIFSQEELNIFNEFLEFDDPVKNKRLYNQFVKAIEFAILTSGKGVKKFSESIYKDKTYILDTNIIFRMLGVGGEDRMNTILKLIESCISQGVKFEYTLTTKQELNTTLEASINKISKGEQSRKVEIIQELVAEAPHFFNDDFIVQYSRLKNSKIVSSPEQYGLEMKSRFKSLCKKYEISQANQLKIETHEVNLFANKLIAERKKLTTYRYSLKQARVDAYNVLYVRKKRNNNNHNYSEVPAFYLTTDRGLNKILSEDTSIVIPATILPSQLFAIHNPLGRNDDEIDFDNFFSFIKRRTSEFKHRGRDVFSYIRQAQVYTTDKEEIKDLILTFTDERYSVSKDESVQVGVLVKFKDFAKTYFDGKLTELDEYKQDLSQIDRNGELEMIKILDTSRKLTRNLDVLITVMVIPGLSILIGLITNWWLSLVSLFVLEALKFYLANIVDFNEKVWKWIYSARMRRTPYFNLTKKDKFIKKGLAVIEQRKGKVWKKVYS